MDDPIFIVLICMGKSLDTIRVKGPIIIAADYSFVTSEVSSTMQGLNRALVCMIITLLNDNERLLYKKNGCAL